MAYVVFDLETTGLDISGGAIIEIAALRVDDAGKRSEFSELVRPRVPIEAPAQRVHGLSMEYLQEHGKDAADVYTRFREFVGDLPLIAHNGLGFDFPFLCNEMRRVGLALGCNRLLDTKVLAIKWLQVAVERFSLAELCRVYAIVNEQAHRALSDVRATVEVYVKILEAEPDMELHWQVSGSRILSAVGQLPAGAELIATALARGLDLEVEYAGGKKAASVRWITPLRLTSDKGAHLYVVSRCLRDGVDKNFRIDRIRQLLQAGKAPEASLPGETSTPVFSL